MHRLARLAVAFVVSAVLVPMAHAHRLDLFVTADGAVIQGAATYVPGGPVQRGTVTFHAPDGSELGEAELASDGSFAFQTPVRCDVTVIVDTPDAHRARTTLPAAELPQALPAWTPGDAAPETPGVGGEPPMAAAGAPEPGTLDTGTPEDLLPVIERAVSRQLAPLRQEIAALEGSLRMRDILGGLGYIAGLAGVLLYVKTRRAKAA